jgi:deoxyribose-phosphate aldolase
MTPEEVRLVVAGADEFSVVSGSGAASRPQASCVDFELAAVVARRDLVLRHALRQPDRPREASISALETVQLAGRDFV